MKVLLLLLVVSCAAPIKIQQRTPASDPTQDLIKHLTSGDTAAAGSGGDRYCNGNPPGSDDAWCGWVCIDGRWSKVCR